MIPIFIVLPTLVAVIIVVAVAIVMSAVVLSRATIPPPCYDRRSKSRSPLFLFSIIIAMTVVIIERVVAIFFLVDLVVSRTGSRRIMIRFYLVSSSLPFATSSVSSRLAVYRR